jgi:preprotein translocase subunit YajC
MKGLMIAEHLAAISVFALVIVWLSGIVTYSQMQLAPVRLRVEAYQAANTALVTGDKQVMIAGITWQVEVSNNGVKVVNTATRYAQTLRRDAD